MSVIKAFSNSGFRSDENIPTTQSRESSTDAVKNDNNNTESATDHPFWRGMNINSYASKKTLAQGMLDLALLAANASQLKFLLGIGHNHQFFLLLLSLVIISISLQILQVLICLLLGLILDLNNVDERRSADICNNICLCIVVLTVAVNVIISAFDIKGDITFD